MAGEPLWLAGHLGGLRPAGSGGGGLGFSVVYWFFTGLLVAVSAGTFAFTGYLLRRLFTTEPGVPDVPAEPTP